KIEKGRILDVGCGNGNLFGCLPDGRYEMFGIDFSENMIAEARKNCGDRAVFTVADAEELPFDDDSFDIVVCNASFHHYIHPDAVAAEMNRVLKAGGTLLIGDPYLGSFARPIMNVLTRFSNQGDHHFYGISEMKKLLEDNGLEWETSVRTGEHTILHIAGKKLSP
ncbi:MAG: class I SAM-dependent methyltransferase, partial [Oscillospiraceae bacterium]|nr:class I SAM-dependent methyltransferase [Oscillospiraceae bacterium]